MIDWFVRWNQTTRGHGYGPLPQRLSMEDLIDALVLAGHLFKAGQLNEEQLDWAYRDVVYEIADRLGLIDG